MTGQPCISDHLIVCEVQSQDPQLIQNSPVPVSTGIVLTTEGSLIFLDQSMWLRGVHISLPRVCLFFFSQEVDGPMDITGRSELEQEEITPTDGKVH